MDKATAKATNALQQLLEEPPQQDFNYTSWKVKCASLIREYFGEGSEEYKIFNQRYFGDAYGVYTKPISDLDKSKSLQSHIKACIDTLKIKGVAEKPKDHSKTNIVSHLSNISIVSGIVGVFLLGASLTQAIHEIASKYSEKPLVFTTPTNKANDDPKAKTDSSENKKQYPKVGTDSIN